MDKISKVVPIRSRPVTKPILLVPNIPTTFYKAFKGSHYNTLLECFKGQKNLNKANIHLIPNIVSPLFTIEQRAE